MQRHAAVRSALVRRLRPGMGVCNSACADLGADSPEHSSAAARRPLDQFEHRRGALGSGGDIWVGECTLAEAAAKAAVTPVCTWRRLP